MKVQSKDPSFLQNALQFVAALRAVGIPVSIEQSAEFTRALTLVDIGSRDQVYFTARCLLLNRFENLRLFETLFNRFWRSNHTPAPQGRWTKPRPKRKRGNIVSLMADKSQANATPQEFDDKRNTYSDADVIQMKKFSMMNEGELEAVKRTMQQMRWRAAERITRRRVADRHGSQLHMRNVLRSAGRHGGLPLHLHFQAPKVKPRPIVLLADISGSMERYSRLLLQFFYCISHSYGHVESFVFGTRLTRITGQLKVKNIDSAIGQASREVIDWAGGTRIGESVQRFNRDWSRRVLRRGAIVIIVSDGWERGDSGILAEEMRFLQHRSHRLIWLNPLSAEKSYKPLVSGMAAAMPYIDDFLPIHNLRSLEELATHLQELDNRKRSNNSVAQYLHA